MTMASDSPIEFDVLDVSSIRKRDSRYDSRAYDLVMASLNYAMEKPRNGAEACVENGLKHSTAEDVLMAFRELALDSFGPMAMTVLGDFGIHSTEDIGEIMRNLCEEKIVAKSPNDSFEDFVGGFNFTEAFVWPFES
jgi:uncharacterized repeat protein (TIGR04138 family)